MAVRSGHRRASLTLALLCLVGCVSLLASSPDAARAAHRSATARRAAPADSRPAQGVAYARIAVVRVLTYYIGTSSAGAAPAPDPTPCAADGVIVGTTGANLNSFTYVLTPTSVVNPISPCAGAQAAFQQVYGPAAGWSIGHIDVLLNAAYTGTASGAMGSLLYSIDASQITTNGGASAPPILALPLTNAPAHDLPVLAVPQPSDAPPDAAPVVLDLTGADGNPLGVDALTSDLVKSTLYPIAVAADQLSQEAVAPPTTTPTATSAVQTVVGGTAAATPAQQVPTASLSTPTPLSTRIMVGAPEIDANGRLIGMVVDDARGNHVIAPLPVVTRQIGAVTGRPGPLMTQWQQGVTAYYANPPQFAQAATAFTALASAYPDFKGVAPFASAAQSQSTTIPSLTSSGGPTTTPPSKTTPATTRAKLLPLLAALGGMALLIVLAWLLLLARSRRRAAAPHAEAPAPVLAEEANLDLLPPDMTLDEVPALELEQTIPLPAINGRTTVPLEGQTTVQLPVAPAARPDLHRSRKGLALMPHAAGLTDPGIKRGGDPNQDNIIALEGFRNAGGRMQPFGLFIVADGMGGHMHGQEASKLAIELVGKAVLQTLSTSQAIPENALLGLLRDSVRQAGEELRERNLRDRADMGTTMAAALVVDDMAYVVNVGDSRAYLMSPETGLRQLTRDHSIVASLIASGVIRPEDIYTHPRRNQIYRSLGGESDGEDPDTFETPLQAGDKLLLCSDGLWEMVRDPQIELILRGAADPRQAAELLVREANANGGEDNISAVVVRLLEDVPSNAQPGVRVVAAPEGSVSVERT